jgi:hypothetical protein
VEITGCSKKLNPKHNKSNIKYTYNKEDIASSNNTPLRKLMRERSNNSHFSDAIVPNENAVTYLGSSTMRCVLVDKVMDN